MTSPASAPLSPATTSCVIWSCSRDDLDRAARQREIGAGPIDPLRPREDARPRGDAAAVAVLSPDVVADFTRSFGSLAQELLTAPSGVIVLVPWKEPPARSIRADGAIRSFLCDGATFRALQRHAPASDADSLCFALLHGLLNDHLAAARVTVKQLPFERNPTVTSNFGRAALIMAHRGGLDHLSTALRSIRDADGGDGIDVHVGLDVEDHQAYRPIRRQFPSVTFFKVDPPSAGLFVVRQGLLERAVEPLFCLHDSDDVSCSDRFAVQFDALRRTGADMLGCHELRIDEVNRTVEAHRFPPDVQAALHDGYADCLLNGTAVGWRRALLAAGGYSTYQRIACDTQFVLRASFLLRMQNVDGFYYLRRRHGASLTVAPETAIGTPLREQLRITWTEDFEAIRTGRLDIAHSSLRPMRSAAPYALNEWIEP
jgi:hypothetical protein